MVCASSSGGWSSGSHFHGLAQAVRGVVLELFGVKISKPRLLNRRIDPMEIAAPCRVDRRMTSLQESSSQPPRNSSKWEAYSLHWMRKIITRYKIKQQCRLKGRRSKNKMKI
jgi:hypothetical protein